jgi:hypothetical protein
MQNARMQEEHAIVGLLPVSLRIICRTVSKPSPGGEPDPVWLQGVHPQVVHAGRQVGEGLV